MPAKNPKNGGYILIVEDDRGTSELRVNDGSTMKDHLAVLIAGQHEMRQAVTDLAHRVTRMEDR